SLLSDLTVGVGISNSGAAGSHAERRLQYRHFVLGVVRVLPCIAVDIDGARQVVARVGEGDRSAGGVRDRLYQAGSRLVGEGQRPGRAVAVVGFGNSRQQTSD